MSTKIYTGYRLPDMTLLTLLDWLKHVQERFRECRNRVFLERFPNVFEEDEQPDWIDLLNRAMEVKRTSRRDPLVDFSAELVLFPKPNMILCITFWDNKEYTQLWDSLREVTFYGWWDNVDPDERCSEEEWQQRGDDWNSVLTGDGVPSQCGFSFTLMDYMLPMPQECGYGPRHRKEGRAAGDPQEESV